jgi:hypothetical protein
MSKISYQLVDKIIQYATGGEIDLILYLARRQNAFGNVRGIYYKDICMELGICKQTFYNALYGLEKKEIIYIDWTNGRDWNITLIDNVFLSYKDFKKGYLNINRDFLHRAEFRNLKPNEKRLILKLLKVYRTDQNFKIRLSKLCQWIGVGKRLLKKYLKRICLFFDIQEKGEMYCFSFKNMDFFAGKSEREHRLFYEIVTFCRRYKVRYTLKDLKDIVVLFGQYAKYKNRLVRILCDTALQYKFLQPKMINGIICKQTCEG